MDGLQEIVEAMQIVSDNSMKSATQIMFGVVYDDGQGDIRDTGVCHLRINGTEYALPWYGGQPQYNRSYPVFVPNGNMSQAFAIAGGGSSYNKYIFRNSAFIADAGVTGFYGTNNYSGTTIYQGNLKAACTSATYGSAVISEGTVDITNYKYLHIKVAGGYTYASSSYRPRIGVLFDDWIDPETAGDSPNTDYAKFVELRNKSSGTIAAKDYVVDLTGISGSVYLAMNYSSNQNDTDGYILIEEMYLSKN